MREFQVIENAGYEDEYTHQRVFTDSNKAWDWARRKFGSEIETLHFQVALMLADGTKTYDY